MGPIIGILVHSFIQLPVSLFPIFHAFIGPLNQLNNNGNRKITGHILDHMREAPVIIVKPKINDKFITFACSKAVGDLLPLLTAVKVLHGRVSLSCASSFHNIIRNNLDMIPKDSAINKILIKIWGNPEKLLIWATA